MLCLWFLEGVLFGVGLVLVGGRFRGVEVDSDSGGMVGVFVVG